MADKRPIAIFDSGIGGLSVIREIQVILPHENLIYLADQAHVPYGSRSVAEITRFSEGITQFFLDQQAKLIVVACNTASSASLTPLRHRFPTIPFVGMEPAVKPAAQATGTGQVGILATAGTLESDRYANLMNRFAQNVTVWEETCPGLVELIESGAIDSPGTAAYLAEVLQPLLARQVDTIVLGCTHYPFVLPLIHEIVGPQVTVIDPAPAIARQTRVILERHNLQKGEDPAPERRFFTTGKSRPLSRLLPRLIGYEAPVATAVWSEEKDRLSLQTD